MVIKVKIKILNKLLSALLAVVLLLQPFVGVRVLAEGEVAADNNQTGTDSSNQSTTENNAATTVDNNDTTTVDNNVDTTANTGDNLITSEPSVTPDPAAENVGQEATPTPEPTIFLEPSESPAPVVDESQIIPSPEIPLPSEITPTPSPVDESTDQLLATEAAELATTPTPGSGTTAENNQTGDGSNNNASASNQETTTVSNNNQAVIENDIPITAQTGNNQVSGEESLVNTGEAQASTNLVNLANTNIVGADFWQAIINVFGTTENDIDLTQIEGFQNFDPTLISVLAQNGLTGDGSVNVVLANFLSAYALYNKNNASLTNNVDLTASSGNNQITGEEGQIQTGDATAQLNLFNLLNTNLIGQDWFFGIINLFGELNGDIILPYELQYLGEDAPGINSQASAANQNTGTGSQNSAQTTVESTTQITNNNDATVSNDISVLANSGNNSIVGEDESTIKTGDAQASANLVNMVNTNITGSRWLLLVINNFGNWEGQILGWWGNLFIGNGFALAWVQLPPLEASATNTVAAGNANTGEDSQNTATANQTNSLVAENNNDATLTNNISVVADTGNNQIQGEESTIQTGNAQATVNVANIVNTNIVGSNWFFGIINIFDWFRGNIIFPRPDLGINLAADKGTVQPGQEITYLLSFQNHGRLWAQGAVITDLLPSGTSFISCSNGGLFQDNKVVWNLGKLDSGSTNAVTLVVRVNSDSADGSSLVNSAQIAGSTNEPDQTDNASSVTTNVALGGSSNTNTSNNNNNNNNNPSSGNNDNNGGSGGSSDSSDSSDNNSNYENVVNLLASAGEDGFSSEVLGASEDQEDLAAETDPAAETDEQSQTAFPWWLILILAGGGLSGIYLFLKRK